MEVNIMFQTIKINVDVFSSFYEIVKEAKRIVRENELSSEEVERIVHIVQTQQRMEYREIFKM